jgi:hypothetical protein
MLECHFRLANWGMTVSWWVHTSTYSVHTRYILDLNMFHMLQGWRWNSSPQASNCVYIDGSFVKHKIPVKPIYFKGGGAWNESSPTSRVMVPKMNQAHLLQGWWCLKWIVSWICMSMYSSKQSTFHPKYVPSNNKASMYYFPRVVCTWYMLVWCTVFTKILQWMLFYVICLWETILCVCSMYAVVLQYWIGAHIGVQHTWLYFGTTYSVHTGMYWYISCLLYISCTGLYSVHTDTYRFWTSTYWIPY